MRAIAIVLTLLVALTPLSVAQNDGGSSDSKSSSSSSQTTGSSAPPCASSGQPRSESPNECQAKYERYCHEHPNDSRCRQMPPERQNDTQAGDSHDTRPRDNLSAEDRAEKWCLEARNSSNPSDVCRRAIQAFLNGDDGDHFVTFRVDEQNLTLLDVRVGGRLVLRSLELSLGSDNVSVERTGHQLRISDNDTILAIHDNPTGLVSFKGADGRLTMTFPANVTFDPHAKGFRINYPSGTVAHLLAEDAVWLDNKTVVVSEFGAFHVPVRGDNENARKDAEKEQVNTAIERRQVGAEVSLKTPLPPTAKMAASMSEDHSVQVLAYDDVQVTVDTATLENKSAPIRVVVSSELTSGRTIVVKLDPTLLPSAKPKDLALRYFDLYDQVDGSVLETEVVFTKASSLVDVLEANDDGGQPEYWIVEDSDGIQILFSVPHWSAHAITISSFAAIIPQPSVVAGFVAGIAISMVAATALLRPRRDDDEDDF